MNEMRRWMLLCETIKAFHGSPYNFDTFDISKIGTGEGAQAYGRGLYFADRPEVAETYHDVKGEPGFMYEVLLHVDPQQLLDLDKPLAQQSPVVQKAMRKLLPQQAMSPEQTIRAFLGTDYAQTFRSAPDVRSAQRAFDSGDAEEIEDWVTRQKPDSPLHNLLTRDTGGAAYERLRAEMGNAIAASAALHREGIPGLMYFDEGSRSAAAGTHNYVVFDDSVVQIIRKYPVTSLG